MAHLQILFLPTPRGSSSFKKFSPLSEAKMNTPGRIKFSQLPALSEVDDSDEVLFRDVDGEDPAQQVGRLSIATLRAAMGGGSPDRIESASGDAFVEASEFNGSPRTIARSGV